MSFQASAWAANVPHGLVGYVAFRTLILLADNAKDDGSAAFMEASTIAKRLDLHKRTVERALKELRHAHLIRYGDQALVDHLPANKRPPVYDLTMLPRDLLLSVQKTELDQVEDPVETAVESPVEQLSPGPAELSAPTTGVGPKLSTGPTTVVAVSKEEPPLTTNSSSRRNHRGQLVAIGQAAPACPSRRDHGPHVFRGPDQWCDYCNRDRQWYVDHPELQP